MNLHQAHTFHARVVMLTVIAASALASSPAHAALSWVQATNAAAWVGRSSPNPVALNGRLWVMGGYSWQTPPTITRNDVWYSTNGAAWTQVTANAPWQTRYAFPNQPIVFNNQVTQLGEVELRPVSMAAFDAPLTNSPGGRITLYNGTLACAGLTNATGAVIEGAGAIDANLTNEGDVIVIADLLVVGDLINNGTIVIQSGLLTVTGTLSGSGTIIGSFGE